ncbi:MAG: FtsQ-type POTRA domain-containing protein, partial [Chloroflexota bacterium]|nr:FtsQ-type POTRA domain-containing protein [Chloroflexota bacterium]
SGARRPRRKRRAFPWRRWGPRAGDALVAVLAALGVVAAASAPLGIRSVEVEGARHTTPRDAVAASHLLGASPFRASGASSRAGLVAALPAVRDATIELLLPDRARVRLAEREPLGRWIAGGAEFFVDHDGVLFASADPAAAPEIRVYDDSVALRRGGERIDSALVDAALRLARIAPGELRADAAAPQVHLGPVGLVLRSGAGWEVRFGGPERFDEKLRLARRFLQDNPVRRIDYLDVRTADRIVISP